MCILPSLSRWLCRMRAKVPTVCGTAGPAHLLAHLDRDHPERGAVRQILVDHELVALLEDVERKQEVREEHRGERKEGHLKGGYGE